MSSLELCYYWNDRTDVFLDFGEKPNTQSSYIFRIITSILIIFIWYNILCDEFSMNYVLLTNIKFVNIRQYMPLNITINSCVTLYRTNKGKMRTFDLFSIVLLRCDVNQGAKHHMQNDYFYELLH
jgi:hypothetical protein